MNKLKFHDYIELIKLLRIDVFFLLAVVGAYMPSVTINQLAQDKYCINKYSENETVCLNLENAGAGYQYIRNEVLGKATTLKMYTTMITTIPGIFFSLFLGYWIDTYPGHLRYLLAMVQFSMVIQHTMIIYQCIFFKIEPMSLLYASIPPALTGSIAVIMTGTYTYMTRKTPAKYRTLRFAILELFLFIAIPLSTSVGGALLGMKPWFKNQPRNYIGVYIVSMVSVGLAGLWVALLLHDNPEDEGNNSKNEAEGDGEDSEGKDEHDKRQKVKECNRSGKSGKRTMAIILDIINIRNVANTLHTAFKRRDHNGRFCLLILMASMTICLIGYMGENSIGFQYAQRVYKWSAEYYSYMSASIISIPAIVTVITPPLLIHKFHFHDTAIGVLGSVSLVAAMFARGLILNGLGFFVGIIFGSFVGLLPIANRSIMSRIIRYNEIGQVYALLSCIESTGPLISSIFYSEIFNATIENSPGTVYIAAGFVVLFPASVMVWLYFTRNTWDLVLLGEAEAPVTKLPPEVDEQSNFEPTGSEDNHQKSTARVQSLAIYKSPENIVQTDRFKNTDDDDVAKLESTSSEIVEKVEIYVNVIEKDE